MTTFANKLNQHDPDEQADSGASISSGFPEPANQCSSRYCLFPEPWAAQFNFETWHSGPAGTYE